MALTVSDVARQLAAQFGTHWNADNALAFGSASSAVTGITVTWTPTLDVLKRAADKKHNLIMALEPPFWNGKAPEGRIPSLKEMENDPTYKAKSAWMEQHRMNVLYVRDGWTQRADDGQLRGLAKALHWESHYRPRNGVPAWSVGNHHFALPVTTFGQLAASMKQSLQAKAIRCIGNPATQVSQVALTHGYFLVSDLQRALSDPQVDVVVCGEPCEWEAAPYFMDLIASGQKKGMIILGSQVSSEPGCGELAAWARTIIKDTPIEWLPAGEPFQPVTGA